MENKNTETEFKYTYSAKEQEEIKKIRQKYQAPVEDGMTKLRKLDADTSRKATMISIVLGTVGALLMGSGMSLVMTDIGTTIGLQSALLPGVIVGLVGMTLALLNYPIYCGILKGRKKKYGEKILALSERIMNK